MKEKNTESKARKIIESVLHIKFDLHDNNESEGLIDYISENNAHSLEVTSHFMQDFYEASLSEDLPNQYIETNILRWNWMLSFDGFPKLKHIKDFFLPSLQILEVHELENFNINSQRWWLSQVPTFADFLVQCEKFQLVHAKKIDSDAMNVDNLFSRYVIVLPSLSWSFGGQDSALELIENFIVNDKKHLAKLEKFHRDRTHLFIWLNDSTHPSVLDGFKNGAAKNLPTRPPNIPKYITDLWLIHEESMTGWHSFIREGWEYLELS